MATVSVQRDGHVLLIGLDRPLKRNAINLEMLADLSRAYAQLEADESLRAGVLFAHGEHFTAGLDLVDVGPAIAGGTDPMPDDGRDPWRLDAPWATPVVAAVHGRCLTLGIELLLAADIRVAAADTRLPRIADERSREEETSRAARDLSVRRCDTSVSARSRLGQRSALAADR